MTTFHQLRSSMLPRCLAGASLSLALAAAPAVAHAQATPPAPPAQAAPRAQPADPYEDYAQEVRPEAPPPDQDVPPPPVAVPQPPVAAQVAPAPAPAQRPVPAENGQWVYTQQYGWLWMPYDQAYTYVAPDGGTASMYVYYPSGGWRWVVAPWIFGVGPRPYWGAVGPVRFAWYARPWFRVGPGWWGHHGGWGYRGPGYRGGWGLRGGAVLPAPRPGAGFHGGGHGGHGGHR